MAKNIHIHVHPRRRATDKAGAGGKLVAWYTVSETEYKRPLNQKYKFGPYMGTALERKRGEISGLPMILVEYDN